MLDHTKEEYLSWFKCRSVGETFTSDDEGVAECPDCDGAGEADDDETCCPGCGACPGFTGVDCDEICGWATTGPGS